MNIRSSLVLKSFATVLSLAMVNLSVPCSAIMLFVPDPRAPKPAPAFKAKARASRLLGAKEMRTLQGKIGESPYVAGSQKWSVNYKGVDLLTGNFTTSGTDLTFEGGYGIPVNVTRSYSANNPDDGPLGKGWTLSVDIRSTAGGLMKGKGSGDRSVPIKVEERPSLVNDPHIGASAQPVEAVTCTDAGGLEETIAKDLDGVLTTPPWDKNTHDSEYEDVTLPSGEHFQVLKSNVVHTPEGTTYVYAKEGSYPYGTFPFSDPQATREASNILKPVTATDRHGNVTTYVYSGVTVVFKKANGEAHENRISGVSMPNGHALTFTWGTGANFNRIVSATDGARTVQYAYGAASLHGNGPLLTGVTTPAGRTTTYEYGDAYTAESWEGDVAYELLSVITDPRGLAMTVRYAMGYAKVAPFGYQVPAAFCWRVDEPSGVRTYFDTQNVVTPDNLSMTDDPVYVAFEEHAGALSGPLLSRGYVTGEAGTNEPTFTMAMRDQWGDPVVGRAPKTPYWERTFDAFTQDLLTEKTTIYPLNVGTHAAEHHLNVALDASRQYVQTDTVYNFMGSPLHRDVTESGTLVPTVSRPVDYAYWGADKYWQQKAVRTKKDSTSWRYSFTDYFDDQAVQGSKGQTKAVFNSKFASFAVDSNDDWSNGNWKYTLHPSDAATCAARFYDASSGDSGYDAKGRPVDVWKLQRATTTPWTYVRTHTTYGADNDGSWGQANVVVEDHGTGKINRTTQTLHYDSAGRADKVQDAAGHQFQTLYNLDGQVDWIKRVDGGLNQVVASYVYGSSGVTNGVPTQVTDGLSGVVQGFTYYGLDNGGNTGQVASIAEANDPNSYTVSYTYNGAGQRETATYATPDGTTRWGWYDYTAVGSPEGGGRAFETLNKLDGSGARTSEEFHYSFDSAGRLTNATFAMTRQTGTGAPTSAPYYTEGYPALSRARAYYSYDPGGRVANLEHYWDAWDTSSLVYQQGVPILGNHCDYDAVKGLKSQSQFYAKDPSSNNWLLERTETYGYDADLDYLTSASYGDGLPNASPTWSYDAAGNRNDATVVDNLNRATTIGGVSRAYDILGNTLSKGASASYNWDAIGRMASYQGATQAASYAYRADGMRVAKFPTAVEQEGGAQQGVTEGDPTPAPVAAVYYRYDGQMLMEDKDTLAAKVTRYGLGARGVDYIASTTTSGTSEGYPVYDAHGNMVATLARSGGGYVVSNRRAYDAWGGIRQGATSGEPRGRYCANLGHVQDDESGLVYMRARFYEPASGRFISEDPGMQGGNWLVYCNNEPVSFVDATGKEFTTMDALLGMGLFGLALGSLAEGVKQLHLHGKITSPGRVLAKGVESLLVATVVAACVVLIMAAITAGAAAIVILFMVALSLVAVAVLMEMEDTQIDRWYPDREYA